MMKLLSCQLLAFMLILPAFGQNQLTEIGEYNGESDEGYFGRVMTAGDFDDDGREEFVITEWGWEGDIGKNFIYQYDEGWPADAYLTVQGDTIWEKYGFSAANLGDFNGDGIDDLGIGLRGTHTFGYGRVDIYFGSADFDTIPDAAIEALDQIDSYATDLDSCGDVNGDGYADLVLLANYSDTIGIADDYHRVEIHFGGETVDSNPDWVKYLDYVPAHCAGLGDVNGDAFGDILVTGWYRPVEIYFGGADMDTIADLILYDYAYNEICEGIGDINGDGINDFLVLLHMPDSTTCYDCVYFGGPDIDEDYDLNLYNSLGDKNASHWGLSSGDLNGDGYSDILSGTSNPYVSALVNIYLGSPWFNPAPDGWVTGSAYDDFGTCIASGDVDGDGSDELLVAAPDFYYNYVGRAWIYDGPEEWIDYGAPVEPGDLPHTPGWYKLNQNYPNPFNSTTVTSFELPVASLISLAVYDIAGQEVARLADGWRHAGRHGVDFDAGTLPSGIYFACFTAGDYTATRKMVLIK